LICFQKISFLLLPQFSGFFNWIKLFQQLEHLKLNLYFLISFDKTNALKNAIQQSLKTQNKRTCIGL